MTVTGLGFSPSFLIVIAQWATAFNTFALGGTFSHCYSCRTSINVNDTGGESGINLRYGRMFGSANANACRAQQNGVAPHSGFAAAQRMALSDRVNNNDTFSTGALLASIDVDGFTLRIGCGGTNPDARTPKMFSYLALGPGVDVFIGEEDQPIVTGVQTISGLPFTPELILIDACHLQTVQPDRGSYMTTGWIDGAGRQGVAGRYANGSSPSGSINDILSTVGRKVIRTDRCVLSFDRTTGAINGEAAFGAYAANAFSLNWLTVAGVVRHGFRFAAIRGVSSYAGSLLQPTAAGVQTISGLGTITPEAIILQTVNDVPGTTPTGNFRHCYGFGTPGAGGACGLVWNGDTDGTTTEPTRRDVGIQRNDAAIVVAAPTGYGTGAESARGCITAAAAGSWDLTWSSADATARQAIYLAVQVTPAAPEPPAGTNPRWRVKVGGEYRAWTRSAAAPVVPPATPTLIAATSKASADTEHLSTDPIDTTGATLIVCSLASYNQVGGEHFMQDSKGNSWIGLASVGTGGAVTRERLYYCINPIAGPGHTFGVSGAAGVIYPAIAVSAWAIPSPSYALVNNGAYTAGASSLATGSVLPPKDNCLIIAGATTVSPANVSALSAGFAVDTQATQNFTASIASYLQPIASAINPVMTFSASTEASVSIAVFNQGI
jgi:hypothetical protein